MQELYNELWVTVTEVRDVGLDLELEFEPTITRFGVLVLCIEQCNNAWLTG